MKQLLKTYNSVIKFILTFLMVYVVLIFGYRLYLQMSTGQVYYPDYVTKLVADQSAILLNDFGYKAAVFPHPNEASVKLFLNEKYVARVIEGCNAISVIILFLSFIIAFSGKLKTTIIFGLVGGVLIYVVNLFRIAVLAIGFYHYPEYENILHGVVFPAIIYGMVFLLWIVWVNRFSKVSAHAKKV
ncbi:exosortase family protein XrtF [Mangrovimonas spongiae]|uniref:Exosortase family protein XrtF n=1 Tax=Mangrovimonas spongiae TaxID=2494697 RepID=A0A3R9N684_9FLAO|nr:exosortase family protein XrtF [Mangrovimonas spongiae]